MSRRLFVLALLVAFLVGPLAGEAQQAGKVYRVGILAPGDEPQPYSTIPYFGPFRQSLADSGYVEGRNVSFAYRWGGSDFRTLPALAIELVRVGVDVLFAASTPAIRALMGATTTIPIVVVSSVLDPIDAGMVASLARPGGNIYRGEWPGHRTEREAARIAQGEQTQHLQGRRLWPSGCGGA